LGAHGVVVCNARGVYDGPMAEWVVGAILAMQRGLIEARDGQLATEWRSLEPLELAGLRTVILGFGSIGSAVAARLRPFGWTSSAWPGRGAMGSWGLRTWTRRFPPPTS